MTDHHRDTFIATLTNIHTKRNVAKKRHVVSVCQSFAATFTENVVSRASIRSDEVTHVLHYAENGYGHSFKHSQSAPDVSNRNVLGRRDKDRSLNRNELRRS